VRERERRRRYRFEHSSRRWLLVLNMLSIPKNFVGFKSGRGGGSTGSFHVRVHKPPNPKKPEQFLSTPLHSRQESLPPF